MAYTLYTQFLGISNALAKVTITEVGSGVPAKILSSPTGGLISDRGIADLDSFGTLSVYLDTAKTYVVTVSDENFTSSPTTFTSAQAMQLTSYLPSGSNNLISFQVSGNRGVLGQVLTATLTNATATGAQWYRDGAAIAGATNLTSGGKASNYTQISADIVPGVEITYAFTGISPTGTAGSVSAVAPTTLAPIFSLQPTVGTPLSITAGSVTGVPSPSVTYVLTVGGVTKTLPYTPVSGDTGASIQLTQVVTNVAGTGSASTSSLVVAATSLIPVVITPPTISGSAVQGQILTGTPGTFTNSPTSSTFRFLRGGAQVGTGTSYTVQAGDVGASITYGQIAINASGSSIEAQSSPTAIVTAPSVDSRPRFGVGSASAYQSGNVAALLASMQPFNAPGQSSGGGSANNSVTGRFTVTPSAGQYGWVAVAKTAYDAAVGVQFFDGVGTGGWSGAGLAGDNLGASASPRSISSITATNASGTLVVLLRQDSVQATGTFDAS